MHWALELQQSVHEIDRLHLKTGLVTQNKEIAIAARGRLKNMTQQISGLILFFKVGKTEAGTYSLEHINTQRIFPSIFCR